MGSKRFGCGAVLEHDVLAQDVQEPKDGRQSPGANDGGAGDPEPGRSLVDDRCHPKADHDKRNQKGVVAVNVHQDAEGKGTFPNGRPRLLGLQHCPQNEEDQPQADHEEGVSQGAGEGECFGLPDINRGATGEESLDSLRLLWDCYTEHRPDRKPNSHCETGEKEGDFDAEWLPFETTQKSGEGEHGEDRETSLGEHHGQGDPGQAGDIADSPEKEMDGEAGLRIEGETVFEEEAAFHRLLHPGGIDEVIVHICRSRHGETAAGNECKGHQRRQTGQDSKSDGKPSDK